MSSKFAEYRSVREEANRELGTETVPSGLRLNAAQLLTRLHPLRGPPHTQAPTVLAA